MPSTSFSINGWPNLPNDKSDLTRLLDWFFEHDAEWMTDALWLRYIKLAKRIYSGNGQFEGPGIWKQREIEHFTLPFAKRKLKLQKPPIPREILPSLPPSDGLDYLSTLPHDLRVEVLSYLVIPDVVEVNRWDRKLGGNTLNKLALVSREWHDQVEAYCSHTLLVWKQKAEDDGVERWQGSCWVEWRDLVTFTSSARMELVVRNRNYCASCGQRADQVSSIRLGMMSCVNCMRYDDVAP